MRNSSARGTADEPRSKNARVKLLFVNRFYWPETPATGQLLTDLAEGLAARGHEVTVITALHRDDVSGEEVREKVLIRRVCATPRIKPLAFALFHLAALRAIRRLAERDTVVIVMTDPPLIGVTAGWAAASRRASCIQWIQDIYPEIAVRLTRHRWLSVLSGPRNAFWCRADRCVTLGADMAAVVRKSGVNPERVVLQSNWGPAGVKSLPRDTDSPLRRAWGLSGKFVVAYSGNFGRVHDLEPLLDLAELLRDESDFAFVFVGSGAGEKELRLRAQRGGLRNVSFQPSVPRGQLSESLAVADLHAVTLLPGCENLVFPSKLYGVAAAGRPVLFIGPAGCEIARVVATEDLGISVTRDSLADAASCVRAIAADPAKWERHAAAAQEFSRRHSPASAIDAWDRLLTDLQTEAPESERTLPDASATGSFR